MNLLLALTACSELETPLRATLDDGQVLMGTVTTSTLKLDGAMGTIEIPVEDIGEIEPVEGGALSGSNGHVTVWLRNGSELRGQWSEPELEMGISAGGEVVPVDLPTDQVMRVQLMEGQVWPEGLVYRVRTTHGDDFLIDPQTTQVSITNELGTFSPFLSECVSLAPVDGDNEGDWRIVLASGTVLVGPLTHDAFDFSMPMGPERVETPLELVAGIDRQDWSGSSSYSYMDFEAIPQAAEPAPAVMRWGGEAEGSGAMDTAEEIQQRYERQQKLDEQVEGWFDNRAMRTYKQTQM